MASTINATTSGIVTIGDSVATLSLQTGGNTAVAIDTAQIVTLSKSLALLGSTSGSVTVAAPAVAGTQSYTLPTAQPTANGQALTATTAGVMSWATAGGSPGGSTTQVQYNNAGAFGGVSGFTTDGTRVTASTTIGVGGATPSASGSGVTFPSAFSASTDPNTLDDYEEGTWTCAIGTGAGSITMNASFDLGSYTKVGRLVTLNGEFRVSSVSSPSGTATITLPFAVASLGERAGYCTASMWMEGASQNMNTYFVTAIPGTTNLTIFAMGTTSYTNAATNFSGDEIFFVNISYQTT